MVCRDGQVENGELTPKVTLLSSPVLISLSNGGATPEGRPQRSDSFCTNRKHTRLTSRVIVKDFPRSECLLAFARVSRVCVFMYMCMCVCDGVCGVNIYRMRDGGRSVKNTGL